METDICFFNTDNFVELKKRSVHKKEEIFMKRIVSLLLAFLLVISLIPMMAFANSDNDKPKDEPTSQDGTEKKPDHKDHKGDKKDKKHKKDKPVYYHPEGEHEFAYASNATFHWLQCPCGCQVNKEYHVDPLDTSDDYCICGYHFSDNAQLVTLWLKDCKELKNFRKDVYEYETDAYTYKDVSELKRIATRTYDSEATVELPEDLTLKEGENKIEIKVTAENKKVTQTYTVIVNKEAK